MPAPPDIPSIVDTFRSSLKSDLPPDVRDRITLDKPAEVLTPDGILSYWHVPVRVGERTIGFMDFSLEGKLVRYGSRIELSDDIPSLPADVMDMNPDDIVAQAHEGATAGATFEASLTLVQDQSPTRLSWMLQGHKADGSEFRAFVTPHFSWSESVETKQSDRK